MRYRRGTLALAVVSTAAGMIAGLTAPTAHSLPSRAASAATGTPAKAPARHTVTLITGDRVTVTAAPGGRQAVDVVRGPGREDVSFVSTQQGDEVSVVPDDALALLKAGKLDASLFNVTRLVQQGYGDERSGTIPLIATYRTGATARSAKAPDGAVKRLVMPRLRAAGLTERKADATTFWTDVAPGAKPGPDAAAKLAEGVDKLWLDAKVKASLDVSVPQIGAPEVWQAGYDGKGAKVAVLDTGVDLDHPDLAGQIDATESFVPGVDSVQDGHGHGTHVASTIAGTGAASGGKYKGVAPGAKLLVGKVLDDSGQGYDTQIMAGMEWAADSGADIVSMSLGGTAYSASDPLSEAVDTLSAGDGPLFVIAAGNAGPFEGTIGTPGIADSALTVGAVSKTDVLASFSSRGPRTGDSAVKPEITAPGVSITAARAAGTTMGTPVDDEYTTANGTSMATPHVAGAVALVLQAHPDWTGAQLKAALASTAKTSASYDVFEQGDGRVDVPRAAFQDVFATPTLSYGLYRYTDSDPATKDITYTNATAEPVTLTLSSTVEDLSLSAGTVTVPAHGTATVGATVDPAKAAVGRHTGYVTATGDKVSVTTGVGFEREALLYDLKVHLLDRDGQVAPYALFTLQELGYKYPNSYGYMSGDETFRVPAGTYSLGTWISVLDAGNHQVGLSVVGDPQIEVTGDTTVTLDARKANEIKPVVKDRDAEAGTITTSWHRERGGEGDYGFGLTYQTGYWVEHLYAAPTQEVTDGLFEFYSKWELEQQDLTASVTSPGPLALSPIYMGTYTGFPVKITGDRKVRAVYAGDGSAAAFDGLDVKGKAVVVGLAADGWPDEALENATKAGAAYLLAYRKTPGLWITAVDSTTIPAMSLTGEEGARLADLLTSGAPVTLKLGGTAVSKYYYNVVLPEDGRIPDKLTYRINSSNTAKVKASYHGSADGQIGYSSLYTFRPTQLYAVGTGEYVPLGTTRTEYYSTGDTRYWHSASQDWAGGGKQWNTLRAYQPGSSTEDWFTSVQRPATDAEFGTTARSGDTVTVRIPEFSDARPGHYGNGPEATDTVTTKLYADGTLVGEHPDAYTDFTVPTAKAAYRLTTDTTRTAPWAAYATRTSTEWRFTSAHTDSAQALPLLSVDYDLRGLDLLGRAPAGRPFAFGLDVRHQEGSGSARIKRLRAWISYDDGKTWKGVTTSAVRDGGYLATVRHPTAAGYASLRIQATDADGNTIDQTVLRAYALRR